MLIILCLERRRLQAEILGAANIMTYANHNELVSVVIPVYNRAETIGTAVKSVLSQTYGNIEVIVVDDGSTEDIYSELEKLNDSRIRYFLNKINMGANYSRNLGIEHANGNYIAFQDSADLWHPEKIQKQMQVFLTDSHVDVVYCEVLYQNKDGQDKVVPDKQRSNQARNEDIYNTLFEENIVDTTSILVKKECLMAVNRFDEEMPRNQDWELCIRLAKSYKFHCINEVLSKGIYRTDSISANWIKLLNGSALLLKKHLDEFVEKNALVYNILHFYQIILEESNKKIKQEELVDSYMQALGKELLLKAGINRKVFEELSMEYRFRMYYALYSKLLLLLNDSLDFSYDFNGKTIAIYGYGTFGKIIYQELCKRQFKISFVIDNNIEDCRIPIYKLASLSPEQSPDVIIVTPVYEFISIQNELKTVMNSEIQAIDDIL